MKRFVVIFASVVAWAGCSLLGSGPVTFEWFNLGTNQVWVAEVDGLPRESCPGRLMPVPAEDRLRGATSIFSESVHVADRIKITWKEAGVAEWHDDLKPGELVPPGATHTAEFSRETLGIPAKLSGGTVRFSYLGENAWRVRIARSSDVK